MFLFASLWAYKRVFDISDRNASLDCFGSQNFSKALSFDTNLKPESLSSLLHNDNFPTSPCKRILHCSLPLIDSEILEIP